MTRECLHDHDHGAESGAGHGPDHGTSQALPVLPLWMRIGNAPFIAVIKVYQFTLSPIMGRSCRFWPTCSWYGLEAYRTHGPIVGTWMTAWRILRCNPFGGHGYDPVPPRGVRDGRDVRAESDASVRRPARP
jgi:putative membrane protein insertion efficiency factor